MTPPRGEEFHRAASFRLDITLHHSAEITSIEAKEAQIMDDKVPELASSSEEALGGLIFGMTPTELTIYATLVLAITAVLTLFFVFVQIRQQTRQAKASFLFSLDTMWESNEFAVARADFFTLRRDTEKQVERDNKEKPAQQVETLLAEEFSQKLYEMRDADTERYLRLLKLCGFFETAGLLVRQDYVSAYDIIGLYGGSIQRLFEVMDTHLQKRREEPGMPKGYFEHFRYLAQITKSGGWDWIE